MPTIQQVSRHLYLITLVPPIPGFDHFISVWLYRGKETFLVDVGPSVTSTELIAALRELGAAHLDYILLTHIHLDHAGGIGDLAQVFPDTPIVCHPAGIDHLVDPKRLERGTIQALGETGKAYGPVLPVNNRQLMDVDLLVSAVVFPIITPGHSQHHVSYQTEAYLFAGEAGGVCFPLPQNRGDYMRPATPPRFFLDITTQSIDALIARNPKSICYSHFGIKEDAVRLLTAHKQQLLLWEELISRQLQRGQGEDFQNRCLNALLTADPMLAGFSSLDGSVQERERIFLRNSILGFYGYLKTICNNPQSL